MTRAAAIGVAVGLVCTAFICGCLFATLYVETSAKRRLVDVEKAHKELISVQKEVLAYAFVPMFRDESGQFVSIEDGLKNFRPSREDLVTWESYDGVAKNQKVDVSGDGAVTIFDDTGGRLVTFLDEEQSSGFFRKIIAGGLAGTSDEALELKRELACKCGLMNLLFLPSGVGKRRIQISIPQLGVNREFSMEEPEFVRESYPDIIEYRSAVEIEKEIFSFVP